ncbi:MAG TPA: FKBP-type peptidyl-prolyl cis-trans isomerase [Solirubrobacteraceae bacterium]|nr:FKBP-type peptidyl-prolyl cis-trans isomerase [Solirubrobacteraceae bacterium]
MTNRSLAIPILAVAALALAGCGSSAAPGIQAAPSAGATSAAATPTTTTPTTTTPTATTPQPTVPLPAAFKTKPSVSIPSGPPPKTLKVIDLIKGTGPAAKVGSTISVQYVGDLYKSHKQFDASWDDGGQPVSFPLTGGSGGVISGWVQGIPGMKEGGRREIIIPPGLAYGKTARPGSSTPGHAGIPANSTLVFVIDLHAVS